MAKSSFQPANGLRNTCSLAEIYNTQLPKISQNKLAQNVWSNILCCVRSEQSKDWSGSAFKRAMLLGNIAQDLSIS